MQVLQFSTREISLDDALDRAAGTLVEVTRGGRVSGVMVDPEVFRAIALLASSSRRSIPVTDLSDDTMARIMESVPEGEEYSLDDLPDPDEAPAPGR